MNRPSKKLNNNSLFSLFFLPLINFTGERLERPNVLVILTDQQSAKMMSCAGNSFVKTPNIDMLAAQGIRYSRAYVTNPVCVPSRFSLMTGRMPSEIEMEGNGEQKNHVSKFILDSSIGTLFSQAGYETVYAGKMHLTGSDTENGLENPLAYGFNKYITSDDKEGREETVEACAGYLTNCGEKPFLLVASLINPHDICYLPLLDWANTENKKNPYPNEKATWLINNLTKLPEGMARNEFIEKFCPPLPDNFAIPDRELPSFTSNHANSYIGWARRNYTTEDWRMYRYLYARLTEMVDQQVGQILDALKRSRLDNNTLVVFTSDHGDQDASHHLGLKTFLYEESVNIPLILKYPGIIEKGVVNSSHLVSNGLDILPTVCDFAGIKTPKSLKGISLKPVSAKRSNTSRRKSLVVETGNARLLITDDQIKYMVDQKPYTKIKKREEMLFDLKTDPGELKNLSELDFWTENMKVVRKQLKNFYRDSKSKLNSKYYE
jgi:arylsulfatase A-like enzyme